MIACIDPRRLLRFCPESFNSPISTTGRKPNLCEPGRLCCSVLTCNSELYLPVLRRTDTAPRATPTAATRKRSSHRHKARDTRTMLALHAQYLPVCPQLTGALPNHQHCHNTHHSATTTAPSGLLQLCWSVPYLYPVSASSTTNATPASTYSSVTDTPEKLGLGSIVPAYALLATVTPHLAITTSEETPRHL